MPSFHPTSIIPAQSSKHHHQQFIFVPACTGIIFKADNISPSLSWDHLSCSPLSPLSLASKLDFSKPCPRAPAGAGRCRSAPSRPRSSPASRASGPRSTAARPTGRDRRSPGRKTSRWRETRRSPGASTPRSGPGKKKIFCRAYPRTVSRFLLHQSFSWTAVGTVEDGQKSSRAKSAKDRSSALARCELVIQDIFLAVARTYRHAQEHLTLAAVQCQKEGGKCCSSEAGWMGDKHRASAGTDSMLWPSAD